MAANIYFNQVFVREDAFTALAPAPLVMNVTLIAPASNDSPIDIRVSGGAVARLPKGQSFRLRRVDLSTVEAMGATFDKLLVAGFTA